MSEKALFGAVAGWPALYLRAYGISPQSRILNRSTAFIKQLKLSSTRHTSLYAIVDCEIPSLVGRLVPSFVLALRNPVQIRLGAYYAYLGKLPIISAVYLAMWPRRVIHRSMKGSSCVMGTPEIFMRLFKKISQFLIHYFEK